jgi:pimeloyl-ACP methyl ester carboxylesterase
LIADQVTGSGPPLVLVHGTTADHTRWAPIVPALAAHFTVHAIDRRGRGGSGDEPEHALEREAADVAEVVDAIGGPVNLLGHSFGALCSLEASLLTPNLRKLVLYEPPIPTGTPFYDAATLARLEALLATGDRERVVGTFLGEVARVPPAQIDVMRAQPAWAARVAAAHTIPREIAAATGYVFDPARFAAMRTPTLLLLGGDSPKPLFGAAIDVLAAALPDARKVVLPGQTHVAIDTAPALFAREVLAFLQ